MTNEELVELRERVERGLNPSNKEARELLDDVQEARARRDLALSQAEELRGDLQEAGAVIERQGEIISERIALAQAARAASISSTEMPEAQARALPEPPSHGDLASEPPADKLQPAAPPSTTVELSEPPSQEDVAESSPSLTAASTEPPAEVTENS
jgi:hypothetical protein